MDILYYIGDGSNHNNRELLYSLRSLEAHCKDVDDVWIVGNKPAFLGGVKYLWVPDDGLWWQNAFRKTMAAINAGISKEFLLMNDDFYMLKDFTAAKYPHYCKGELPDMPNNKYQEVLANTKRILQREGYPTKHFGVHCPMRIDSEKYKQIERFYQGRYSDQPVSARCLYGNLFCRGIDIDDNKSKEFKNGKTGCYSSTDWVDGDTFQKLEDLFPNRSKWEENEI